jgi:ligand-binding SRPBCC domain-containing protein
MPTIHLTTFIAAPAERIFDLSRSIDLHKKSMAHTQETAVGGTTLGLIENNETVTWKAKHLGKMRLLKIRIASMNKPLSFTDEMVSGDFRSMRHEHHFESKCGVTVMRDKLLYEVPYGVVGELFDLVLLKMHMTKFLSTRNQVLKKILEKER